MHNLMSYMFILPFKLSSCKFAAGGLKRTPGLLQRGSGTHTAPATKIKRLFNKNQNLFDAYNRLESFTSLSAAAPFFGVCTPSGNRGKHVWDLVCRVFHAERLDVV